MDTPSDIMQELPSDIMEVYPEGCDRFAYLKEYVLSNFKESVEITYPSLRENIRYLCKFPMKGGDHNYYLFVNKSLLETYETVGETVVSIFLDDYEYEETHYDNPEIAEELWKMYLIVEKMVNFYSTSSFERQYLISQAHDNGACSVCLEDYKQGEDVAELYKCEHIFCEACISEWLEISESCPLCRSKV